MRKFIVAIVVMLGVVFILGRTSEVNDILETLKKANYSIVLLAAGLVVAWLINQALAYWVIYRSMEMEERFENLLLLVPSAFFVNVVAPSGGMSGIAVFVAEARRKGISSARVMVANALYVMLDYMGFLAILGLAVVVMFRRNTLNSWELAPALFIIALLSVLGFLMYQGMRSSLAFGNALAFMARQFNRLLWPFLHRDYIAEYRAHEFAHDAAGGLRRLRSQPRGLLLPALLALNSKLLLLVIFALSFAAFQVPLSLGTIVVGYSIGFLFTAVSPTPGGLGIVEGVLPLVLSTMWVPLGTATVITLTFRALTLWLPLLIGMATFNWMGREHKRQVTA